MFFFIVISLYSLSITALLRPSLFPPSSFPETPSSPLISKALPSFSIPQVHHTESHCVSGLGRERTVQPLTMCCRWTHLRRPQTTTVQLFHTHTLPLPVPISSLVPSPFSFSNSIIPSLFFRSHFYAFGNQPPSTGFTLFF